MQSAALIKPYLRAYAKSIVIGLLALITVDLMQLVIPRVIKVAVDDLAAQRADAASLSVQALLIVAAALAIGVFRYVWRRSLLGMARKLEASLRNRLMAHLQTLSADYFDQATTGDLMAHATNDINQVRMAAGMGLVAFNDAVVLGAAAIVFMLYINVTLTLYVLIPMPLIVLGTRLLGRRMHQRYQSVQGAFSDLTETLRERIAGIRMIKAHTAESAAGRAVAAASQAYVDENIRLVGITSIFFPLMMLLTNLSLAIVLWLGGRRAILAQITPGDFVAFISYLNLLTWPMMALGWVTNLIQRGGASLERLKRILDRQPAVRNRPDSIALPRTRGEIVFEDVGFTYPGAERPALQQINLQARPGRTIGIVGPPGSGKSTLLALPPRLYDVSRGRILLDGVDIRALTLADLRRTIAYVPQEPFLFAGTIRDNLTFGCAGACDEQRLQHAIAAAALERTLTELPAGIDTLVGEKGVLLSGGQKQRIALARALLLDLPILLLDDPISQVDTTTGGRLVATFTSLAATKTVIVVSHRLTAVRPAEWIISLDQGRVDEAGTHQQLLARRGYYARVHALQELDDAL